MCMLLQNDYLFLHGDALYIYLTLYYDSSVYIENINCQLLIVLLYQYLYKLLTCF